MTLSPQTIRDVAHRARVHPDSVRRYLNGARQSPTMRDAIERALRREGLAAAIRPAPAAPPVGAAAG